MVTFGLTGLVIIILARIPAAVQEVTFLVKQGSFIVIAGGSGSGKSTLGRLLSGLEKPHGGHVFLDDYELHTLDPKKFSGET